MWITLLEILDAQMTRPTSYGWFHIVWLALVVIATVLLCRFGKNAEPKQVRRVVWVTAVIVIVLEIYKHINYTFIVNDGVVTADYQWYIFPFQFCSMPMYVGLLAGLIPRGKVHRALCSFLATYALFAGVCVMVYPNDVFIETIGINIQTMICHGSMIVVGVYLLYTNYVKLEHKTILYAVPVFSVAVGMAAIMNEIAYRTGLLETETFNMFFISPHCDPSLPVYSIVQAYVPFPWCLIIYIAVFSIAAYVILLIAMGIRRLGAKKEKL